jgi:protein gp37
MNSISDLFHAGVSDDYIVEVAKVMTATSGHTFQVRPNPNRAGDNSVVLDLGRQQKKKRQCSFRSNRRL